MESAFEADGREGENGNRWRKGRGETCMYWYQLYHELNMVSVSDNQKPVEHTLKIFCFLLVIFKEMKEPNVFLPSPAVALIGRNVLFEASLF